MKGRGKRLGYEFGKNQSAEKGPPPPGEPFVNGNHRSVILLDLLLAKSKVSNKRNVKIPFDHGIVGFKR
jgi:hypothetical protein